MERSLDAYKFNLLHNKQLFIRQLKNRTLASRTIDEGALDESTGMSYSEYVAILSGNTDLLDKAKLEKKIAVLESERQAFHRSKGKARATLKEQHDEIVQNDRIIGRITKDWEYLNRVAPADKQGVRPNPLKLDGVDSADVKVMGEKLAELNRTLNTHDDYEKIGTLFDFRILVRSERMDKDGLPFIVNKFMAEGLDGIKYNYNNGHIAADPRLACENFIKALDTMPKLLKKYRERNEELTRDIPILEEVVNSSWNKDKELQEVREELATLNRKIAVELAEQKKVETEVAQEVTHESKTKPETANRLYHQERLSEGQRNDDAEVPDFVSKAPIHVPGNTYIQLGGGPKL